MADSMIEVRRAMVAAKRWPTNYFMNTAFKDISGTNQIERVDGLFLTDYFPISFEAGSHTFVMYWGGPSFYNRHGLTLFDENNNIVSNIDMYAGGQTGNRTVTRNWSETTVNKIKKARVSGYIANLTKEYIYDQSTGKYIWYGGV